MEKHGITRRGFLGKSAMTTGMAALGTVGIHGATDTRNLRAERLPREVWIASVSQMDLQTETSEEMVRRTLDLLEEAVVYQPDIVCLPEVFVTSNVRRRYTLEEEVELSAKAIERLSEFSRMHRCYSVCPVYTTENGRTYNSAVFIDREGKRLGEFRKIRPTEGEIESGISPGPLQPPVFKTDFGVVGAQICFDILWDDGWKKLREQGAEIVFWPSAYAGGEAVNARAWQNKYVVVSSTRKHTTKICDISGGVVASTGIWNKNWVCAPVNLEKAFLHVWPYVQRFPEIRKKYGRKVQITIHDEEEWAIIESLSPDVAVRDILKEFDLKTHEEHTRSGEIAQARARDAT